MSTTNNAYLPSYEDLYVPPLNITSPVLKAGAIHFGVYCFQQSNEFMLCRKEERDPRKCLDLNKKLSACANDFFHKVRDNCAESFTKYWQCLDYDPKGQMSYTGCQHVQVDFDNCMKNKLNMERPPTGQLSRIRLHETNRVKPIQDYKKFPIVPEPPRVSDIDKYPEAKDSLKRTDRFE